MYDISTNPSYIQTPRANTRQADKITFVTDIVNYDIYQKSPYYVGTELWNKLPVAVQGKASRAEFKTEIKRMYGHHLMLN